MTDNWLPDHGEDPAPSQPKSRGPLYFLIASAAILFLVVTFIFYTNVIGQGRDLGDDGETPAPPAGGATVEASAEPTDTTPTEEPSPSEEPSPTEEPTPVRPAPEGAIEAVAFTTPASNIHCRINNANVECSIYVYDYPSPGQCEGITATYSVGAEGEVDADCQYFVRTNAIYDYGTAVALNGFACTLEQDGVTCWSEMSGHGFNLTRATDRIF